jgi:hypothetical protein
MRDGYPPVVERWEKVPLGSRWMPTLLRQTRRTAQIALRHRVKTIPFDATRLLLMVRVSRSEYKWIMMLTRIYTAFDTLDCACER